MTAHKRAHKNPHALRSGGGLREVGAGLGRPFLWAVLWAVLWAAGMAGMAGPAYC
jgi:hypothetical protein